MRGGSWRRAVVFWATGLAFFAQASTSAAPCHAQTTVFIVRHAEKGGIPANNPRLTEAGRERAKELARVLRSVRLTAVLTSEFERTVATVRPTAEAKNLEIKRHRARDVAGLAQRILKELAGKTLLVAGHSDTIPVLLTQLGVDRADAPEIADDEYDNLFVLFIGKGGAVTLQRLRYGAPSEGEAPRRSPSDAAQPPTGE